MPKSFSASTGRLLDFFLCRKQTFSDCCRRIQSPLAFQYRHHLLDNHLRMRGSFKSTILLSISFLSHSKIQSLWSPNTYGSYLPHCCWVLVQCSLVFLSYRRSSPLRRGFPGQLWGWHLQFLCSSFALLIGPAFIGTVLIVYLQRWFVDVSKVPFTEKRPLQIVTADKPSLPVLVGQVPWIGWAIRYEGKGTTHQPIMLPDFCLFPLHSWLWCVVLHVGSPSLQLNLLQSWGQLLNW